MISLARGLRETLERHALSSGAEEACGLILGTASRLERFRPARNLARHPKRAFELDPGDLVAAEDEARASGLEVVGVWHSHPSAPAIPSEEDRRHAYAGWLQLISSARDLRCWEIRGTSWVELSLRPS